MNREEILEKSKKEKDEGMEYAENKGRRVGITAFSIVFIIVVLVNFFTGQRNDAVFAMFWAFLAAEAYPKYKFCRKRSYLVSTVAGALVSAVYMAVFIISAVQG